MHATTNTNLSPLPPSTYAAIAANRAIDAALALDVSKLNVAEINAEATEAAAEAASTATWWTADDMSVYLWDGRKCWYMESVSKSWKLSCLQEDPNEYDSFRRMTPAEIDAFKASQCVSAFKPLADMAADVAATVSTPDARLDRAYATLKAQLSRFERYDDHTKAACISHIVAQVEYAAESLTNHADEADEDDKRRCRNAKCAAEFYNVGRVTDNDVPEPGTNTNNAVY